MFLPLLVNLLAFSGQSNAHPLVPSRVVDISTRAVTSQSKAGLPWPNGPSVDIDQFQSTRKVSWYYTWSINSIDTDLEFVPMFWGTRSIQEWSGINEVIAQRKPVAALGFNEPEESGQANLSPQDGAYLWQTYLEPLKAQGLRLGSPAPSSATSGKTWLQNFLNACNGGCTVDFIALHWYGTSPTAFIAHLQDLHNTLQRPIWVTEWACQNFNGPEECSQQDMISFMSTTQSFMDKTDWIERYAWYGAFKGLNGYNSLMDSSGVITDLGLQYIGSALHKSVPNARQQQQQQQQQQ